MYNKCRFELVDGPKPKPSFIRNDLAEKLRRTLRKDNRNVFRKNFGFNVIDIFNTNEQSILEVIKEVFQGEDMEIQYKVLNYRIDLNFQKYKIAVEVDEVDEYGHCECDEHKEIERHEAIKERLGYVFIRINLDEQNFNINEVMNQIHKHINKSKEELIKEKTKNFLI